MIMINIQANKINTIMKIGDKVEIVKYGHLIWTSKKDYKKPPENIYEEDDHFYMIDLRPELVGKKYIITDESKQCYELYSAEGKMAWFSKEQLKLI